MPVDRMARSVIELSGLARADSQTSVVAPDAALVYQVRNRSLLQWTDELLPALRASGLEFRTVSQQEWMALLRASGPDPVENPTIKLLDFFADKYDNDRPGREGLVFETQKTEEDSDVMKEGYDVVKNGLVEKMVSWWKTQW